MVSSQLCRAPKLHEGLAHLFTKTENFTQSTTEIVVPSSQIYDRPHCTTMYKCTCISEAGPDISIRGIRFISETIYLKKYQKIPRRNSKRKLQDMIKRTRGSGEPVSLT